VGLLLLLLLLLLLPSLKAQLPLQREGAIWLAEGKDACIVAMLVQDL
jgi:hypothetical protein